MDYITNNNKNRPNFHNCKHYEKHWITHKHHYKCNLKICFFPKVGDITQNSIILVKCCLLRLVKHGHRKLVKTGIDAQIWIKFVHQFFAYCLWQYN